MMQNKIKRVLSLSLIIATVFILRGIALGEDFSADVSNTAGGRTFQGKIFASKQKTRMETPQGISITRLDKKVIWLLMPAQQMYMEEPFNPANIAASAEKMPGEIERKLIGSEIIDGRKADKYRIVYTDNSGRRWVTLQWIVPGLNIPVKSAAEDGSWMMEYKNIKTGAQPDALFEVPAGYKKFSYEMGMPQDMQQ